MPSVSRISFEVTAVPGLMVVRPQVFVDARGSFTKLFTDEAFSAAGLATSFAEEYRTRSARGVVRGMHFQLPPLDHEKLVFCSEGEVLDVVLDLRRGSPTFGQALTFHLSAPTGYGLYIPVGCAHGFCSLSEQSTLEYRVTGVYSPTHDAGILWSSLDVDWPVAEPIVSARDTTFPELDGFVSPFVFAGA